jgi:hypothetical protein
MSFTQTNQTSTPSTVTTTNVQFVGPDVMVAAATGNLGFFGTTPALQAAGSTITDFATLKAYLQTLGLIGA